MDDRAGAAERPEGSRIRVHRDGDATVVTIPRPRMPLIVNIAIGFTSFALVVVAICGFMAFVMERRFPGYGLLFGGPIRPMPTYWRIFGIGGWLTLLISGAVTVLAAVKPLTRREQIRMEPSGMELRDATLGASTRMRFALPDLGEFRRRADPQGLVESELIVLLNRPVLAGGEDEMEFGRSTTESEKLWLASLLNDLLERYRKN